MEGLQVGAGHGMELTAGGLLRGDVTMHSGQPTAACWAVRHHAVEALQVGAWPGGGSRRGRDLRLKDCG